MGRVGDRKERSDKKKEVKPTISIELKDAIYRIGYITHTPVKDVCEQLCIHVMNDEKLLTELSTQFQRDIRIGQVFYIGNLENKRITKREIGEKERVTIKFRKTDYETIYRLGYALDCRPSRIVAILLQIAIWDMKVVNAYVKQYLQNEITDVQMKELKNVIRYINSETGTHHSWIALISHITADVGPLSRIKDAVTDFFKS